MLMEEVKQGVLLQGFCFEIHIETAKGISITLSSMEGERGC